ncbi:MAG: cyclodeaminase/cyclohydrolase family protein [Clostridiales bacterium]|nr:cyclodeaminase/cyclohydrolase family protein [Clostridiales bacterium]
MSFLANNIQDFSDALASKAATPGGGGGCALVGALGAALGNMVGNLTVGKKTYAAVEGEIVKLMEEIEGLRKELLGLIDEDAVAFEPLSKAYSIPKDDPTRDETMESCLKIAADVPMRILRACCKVIDLQKGFAEKGSALAVSDAGCGVVFCKAAMQGAALNVLINTKSMKDRAFADGLNTEVKSLLDKYGKAADQVYDYVFGRME